MTASTDALALLRETIPERIWRFCESLLASKDLDVQQAAIAAGAPGQARALFEDRRTLVLLGALQNELRETHKNLRHQLVGMLARMATFDPADAFQADGLTLRSIRDMPVEVRMALDVAARPDGSAIIKFSAKYRLEAIKLLFSLFGDLDSTIAPLGTSPVIFRGREAE